MRAVEAEPWIAALADYIEQNAAAFRETSHLFPRVETEALTVASRGSHARIRDLLLERGRLGLIRHLHGDLHLGNIVLLGGRPVLFDAIEFDPLVAVGEVLYDLAFLLMDLVERELESCANVVFNRYLLETKRVEDLDALAGLPLFLSMRAAIRAKVTAARAEHATPDRKAALERSACTYFDFACRFIAPSRPVLVAVGGLSGTGKSALARALAPQLGPAPGAVVLRSDVERKTLFGKDEHDKLPSDAYSPEVTARVYTTIADKARRTVAAATPPSSTPSSPSRRSALWWRCPPQSSACPFTDCSSTPSSTPGSLASVRAAATPPTRPRPWPAFRRTMTSARLHGRASTPPVRWSKRSRARRARSINKVADIGITNVRCISSLHAKQSGFLSRVHGRALADEPFPAGFQTGNGRGLAIHRLSG